MKKSNFFLTGLLILLMTGSASATIITGPLGVDFRSSSWSDANGQPDYTVDGVTAISTPQEPGLYQDSTDGLGVLGDEHDELDDNEAISVVFEQAAKVTGVWITDLFGAPDGGSGEAGIVELFGPNNLMIAFDFYGQDADQENGELFVDFGGDLLVDAAIFSILGESFNNEFSVAGFESTPVPEPATMLLLGAGLLGIAGFRRKLINKNLLL